MAENNSEEINLLSILNIVKRNKNLFYLFCSLGVIVGSAYALIKEKTWQGGFQIVVDTQKNSLNASSIIMETIPQASSIFGLSQNKNKLQTQVGILKSPSVLMPVFNFVRDEKEKSGENIKEFTYSDWLKDNVNIELVKKTSILNLEYEDNDKELIRPVLEKISSAYKEYSVRDRRKGIKSGIEYLNKQIIIYTDKSRKSTREAERFAFDQQLTLPNSNQITSANTDQQLILPNSNQITSANRQIITANKIKILDQQLEELKKIDNNTDSLIYLLNQFSANQKQDHVAVIRTLDREIEIAKTKFKPGDQSIVLKQNRKKFIVELLKKQIYEYIQAERALAVAEFKAYERPIDVHIKYRELFSNAKKDIATLEQLENKRRMLTLEKERTEAPWELITKPTVLDKAVAPKKRNIVAIFLILSTIVSYFISFIKERLKNLVYDKNELKNILDLPIIEDLSNQPVYEWEKTIKLLANNLFNQKEINSITLIKNGFVSEDVIMDFKNQLSKASKNNEVLIKDDITDSSRSEYKLFIAGLGTSKKDELRLLKNRLNLQNNPEKNIGIVILENIF